MALFFADLVREACWDEGAGALALAGALPGHRAFADAVPPGARFHYAIAGSTRPDEWEVGEGELDGAGKLSRQPIASSGGGAVDFSPGLKTVALTVLADWFTNFAGATGIGEVEGLSEALAGKAAVSHSHAIGEVTGLGPALDAKAPLAGASFTGAVSAPSLTLGNDLAVADGGTGASSAAAARTNLGLGTLATQNANAVTIGGGAIAGLSSLGVTGNVTIGGAAYYSTTDHGSYVGGGDLYRYTSGSQYFQIAGTTRLALASSGLSVTGAGSFSGNLTVGGTAAISGVTLFESYTTWRSSGTPVGDIGPGNVIFAGGSSSDLGITSRTAATVLGYGNVEKLRTNPGGVSVTGGLDVANGAFSVAGTQIAGPRRTGWSGPTGTASRTGFDTASVTTQALAERVKALIDDLAAHGLIGS